MIYSSEGLIKLALAVMIGGIVNAERERHNKAAGLRAMILICVGSALFTIFSIKIAGPNGDPTRIAANIVSGIGFLGAGVILRESGRITGLTTAATIWLSVALGMGIWFSLYFLVAAATLIITIVLWIFLEFENRLSITTEVRTYAITCNKSWDKFKELKCIFKEQGMAIKNYNKETQGTDMICILRYMAPPRTGSHGPAYVS